MAGRAWPWGICALVQIHWTSSSGSQRPLHLRAQPQLIPRSRGLPTLSHGCCPQLPLGHPASPLGLLHQAPIAALPCLWQLRGPCTVAHKLLWVEFKGRRGHLSFSGAQKPKVPEVPDSKSLLWPGDPLSPVLRQLTLPHVSLHGLSSPSPQSSLCDPGS